MTLLNGIQQGQKEIKSKSIGEKAKKKETRTREKVTRKERCEKKMKSRRSRERERERRSEESFPQHKFYYEKLSDKKNATDYTRVLVHIIYFKL